MPMMFCNEDFDFIEKDLGYKVGRDRQLFSLQGGVFSTQLGVATYVSLQHGGSSFPARADYPFGFDLYESDDGTPFEYEDLFLYSVAVALRAKIPFDKSGIMSRSRTSQSLILPIHVELANITGFPTVGNSVDISDENGQTISALLFGMTLAEDKNLMTCWFALSPEQSKVPTFKAFDRD